jgi:hypothetical protein
MHRRAQRGRLRAGWGWRAGAQCGSERAMTIDSTQILPLAASRRVAVR